MDDILIRRDKLKKAGLTINEYLVLYNIVNKNIISEEITYTLDELVSLESKGFIKLTSGGVKLRGFTEEFFSISRDTFEEWLSEYPKTVHKKSGGTRALSPVSSSTILGKKLRTKWNKVFSKRVESEEKAIKVLRAQVKHMKKTGDLEWMVEASRWLNEGYHEKYEYLLEDDKEEYNNEDYL